MRALDVLPLSSPTYLSRDVQTGTGYEELGFRVSPSLIREFELARLKRGSETESKMAEEDDAQDTPPPGNPSACTKDGDNSKIVLVPSDCRERLFFNFLRRIQALTKRYLSSADNTRLTAAIKLGYATNTALELYSPADRLTHTRYTASCANHTPTDRLTQAHYTANHTLFLQAVRDLVVQVSKPGDNKGIDST